MRKRILTFAMALLLCVGLVTPAFAASDVSEELTMVSVVGNNGNTLYGYKDQNGNTVIPIEYEELGDFEEGVVLGRKNGYYYLLNGSGSVLASMDYDEIEEFNENGYARVHRSYTYDEYVSLSDQNWRSLWLQYGDPEQDEILSAFQKEHGSEYEGRNSLYALENFIASNREFYDEFGYWLDLDWELSQYGSGSLRDGRRRNDALREVWNSLHLYSFYGVIDRQGNEIIAPVYQSLGSISEDGRVAVVGRYDRDGVLRQGTTDGVPMQYNEVRILNSGVAVGLEDTDSGAMKYGLLKYTYGDKHWEKTGTEEVLPVEYDFIDNQYNELAYADLSFTLVGKDGKYGCLDRDGAWIIPMEYDWIGYTFRGYTQKIMENNFQSGSEKDYSIQLIPVQKNGKYGCVDTEGNLIVSTEYSEEQWNKKVEDLKKKYYMFSVDQIVIAVAAIFLLVVLGVVIRLVVRKVKKRVPGEKKAKEKAIKPTFLKTKEKEPATPAPDAKFCPNCGKPIDPNAKFCQNCGKPLDGGGDTHEA